MLINEVAKLSALTKKAVEYYTEQGLIFPNILENGYRDFSEQDIEILKKIALFRRLGLSIFEIKSVLANPDELKSILYKKTLELEQEKVKQDILKRLCNGESIEKLGDSFLNRVFTENEIKYCESKKKQKYQHYAARFAGKEAVFKAISPILKNKFSIDWTDVEILNDKQGRPYVTFYKEELKNINVDLSLSHIKDYAVATAVAVINSKFN